MPNNNDFVIKNGVLTEYTGEGEEKVTIPDSVTKIGENIFAGCSNLKNIKAPAGFKDTLPEKLKKQVKFTVYNEKKQKYTILNSCCIE